MLRPAQDLSQNQVFVSEVLLFPSSFACLTPRSDALFSVNCTPQVRPEVPLRVSRRIHNTHFPADPLSADESPRYIHIGRTNALGLPLHFYAMLASDAGDSEDFGPTSSVVAYKEWFDLSVVPALGVGAASKFGLNWDSWREYYSSQTSSSRNKSKQNVPIEQNLPVSGVHRLWHRLIQLDRIGLLNNAVLFAYGSTPQNEAHAKWADFSKAWERHIGSDTLKEGSKITTGIDLKVGA